MAVSYPRKQSDELERVREAIRPLNIMPPPEPCFDLVEEWWIAGDQGQLRYFQRRARRDRLRMERIGGWARVLYGSGLALAVGVAALTALTNLPSTLLSVLIILMAVIPAGVSLWLGWAEKMTLDEQSKQYARMGRVFHRAKLAMDEIRERRLTDEDRVTMTQELLRDLGSEALIENGDWVLLHRERPVEIPR